MATNPARNSQEDLDIRISKMISEGGIGVEAYYNIEADDKQNKAKEEVLASKMVSEGGLGAEIYNNIDEKIGSVDGQEDKKQIVN